MQMASKLEKLRTREATYLSNPPPWDLRGTFWSPVFFMKGNKSYSQDLGNKQKGTEITPHNPSLSSTDGQGEESLKFALERVGLGEVHLVNLLGPWC